MRVGRILVDGAPELVADLGSGLRRVVGTSLPEILGGARPRISGDEIPESALCAPLEPSKILGIGLNYADTIREMGLEPPKEPYLFAKYPSSVVGPNEPILFDPELTSQVDWEGELAVVIGRTARNVPRDDALSYVFGYTIANDVSARDLQAQDGQWVRGKSLDTFCPLGPVVVDHSALSVEALEIQTQVNGFTKQHGNTRDLVFSIPDLVAYCSRHFTLQPGDVILTGTPTGCGHFMPQPEYLSDGDTVEVAIEGIGVLRSPVRHTNRNSG